MVGASSAGRDAAAERPAALLLPLRIPGGSGVPSGSVCVKIGFIPPAATAAAAPIGLLSSVEGSGLSSWRVSSRSCTGAPPGPAADASGSPPPPPDGRRGTVRG